MTSPVVTYINAPSFPDNPSKQRYHLRRLNWMVPFEIPNGHQLVVSINGERTEDFSFYASVVTLKKQPADHAEIVITTEELEEDESNT